MLHREPHNNELDRSGGKLLSNGGVYFRRPINSSVTMT